MARILTNRAVQLRLNEDCNNAYVETNSGSGLVSDVTLSDDYVKKCMQSDKAPICTNEVQPDLILEILPEHEDEPVTDCCMCNDVEVNMPCPVEEELSDISKGQEESYVCTCTCSAP